MFILVNRVCMYCCVCIDQGTHEEEIIPIVFKLKSQGRIHDPWDSYNLAASRLIRG